jgi:hypothetical protein
MITEVNAIVAKYPAIVSKRVLGRTYEGRDIVAVKISDNVGIDGDLLDWMRGTYEIFAYTVEMYPTSSAQGGVYPPGSVITRETARNKEAAPLLAEAADCPYRVIGKQAQYC